MIARDPQRAAASNYDLIVVGGGIYGVCTVLEAARRGLRPALIERDDFGGATSWNSLRIIHGGLRYLQKMDLQRFRESVGERRWFCRHFPDLVRPLACLMPLYGQGLKRPTVLRAALAMNDWLSRHRNDGVDPALHLPGGEVLSAAETVARFASVDRRGLQGAALWHDAVMLNSQRVLIEALHWACACGATAMNYVQAEALLTDGARAAGVRARDRVTGQVLELRGRAVINCAGPWSQAVAARLDREVARLFRPSLAFNVLLDRAPLSTSALAVTARTTKGPVYFLHPWRGRILAGTVHAPWRHDQGPPKPSEAMIESMLRDLRAAVPELELRRTDVLRVYAGLLPAAQSGTSKLAVRPVIHDHGEHNGPHHLFSVSGVKFTTAREVAEKTLRQAWAAWGGLPEYQPGSDRPAQRPTLDLSDPQPMLHGNADEVAQELHRIANEESVVHLDDLLLRRTDWLCDPQAAGVAERVRQLLMPERGLAVSV